jgi:hypothetical protein
MSSNSFSLIDINNNLSNLKENFINSKEQEASPINPLEYVISIEGARTNMVNWLSFLCSKLNFSDQTLFRSISLFDQYISRLSIEQAASLNQETLNLITIACLSLSTKLEEINCNYISFLNEKVLNSSNSKIFTNKDLTQMELRILKALKFKTLYSTPLDFMDIYIEIYRNVFSPNDSILSSQLISNIKNLSISLMKSNINNVMYLTNTSSHFAYLSFIQALNQISMMNSPYLKQLQKSILTFNYQFSNIL